MLVKQLIALLKQMPADHDVAISIAMFDDDEGEVTNDTYDITGVEILEGELEDGEEGDTPELVAIMCDLTEDEEDDENEGENEEEDEEEDDVDVVDADDEEEEPVKPKKKTK